MLIALVTVPVVAFALMGGNVGASLEQTGVTAANFLNVMKNGDNKKPCQYGLSYSSIMGRGKAEIVEDVQEKMKAMTMLMKTQTQKDFSFNESLVSIVAVIWIDVAEYTAKHRPVPERLR